MGFLRWLGKKIRIKLSFYYPVNEDKVSNYARKKARYYANNSYLHNTVKYFKGKKNYYKVKIITEKYSGKQIWKISRKKKVFSKSYDSLIGLVFILLVFLVSITAVNTIFPTEVEQIDTKNLIQIAESTPLDGLLYGLDIKDRDEIYLTGPSERSYYYKYGDLEGYIDFTLYDGFYSDLKEQSHTYSNDEIEVYEKLLQNKYQDRYLQPFVDAIKTKTSLQDEQVRIAVSIVQHLEYSNNYWNSYDWKYPYETLYNKKGVCSDKSVLLAYLIGKLGYDVVILNFDQDSHEAVGIKTYDGLNFKNTGYSFIETTTPTIITYEPKDYYGINGGLTSPTDIIDLWDGTKILTVKDDSRDANLLSEYDNKYLLEQSEYDSWLYLVKKYDIQVNEPD